MEVVLARPWSDWDAVKTCMPAVTVLDLMFRVSGHVDAAERRAVVWSCKMCIRGVCEKSAETRVA